MKVLQIKHPIKASDYSNSGQSIDTMTTTNTWNKVIGGREASDERARVKAHVGKS